MTMEPDEIRLLGEAVAVTIALMGIGGAALYGFVQARRRTPDALAALNQTMDEMSIRLRNLERDRRSDHLLILRLQSELEQQKTYSRALADYSRMLAERLRELGQEVPAAPVAPPEMEQPVEPPNDQMMPQVIAALFNLEEIDDLAFQLGLNVDDLDGSTVSKRARSLVTYMRRRGRMDELVALVRQLRPKQDLER